MIGLGDGLENGVEVADELGVITRDLLLPDASEQYHLMTIAIDDLRQDGLGIRHTTERAEPVGRSRMRLARDGREHAIELLDTNACRGLSSSAASPR